MSEKIWTASAIIVIVVGIFVGTTLSNSTALDFLENTPLPVEQIEFAESPWTQIGNTYTTQVEYDAPGGVVTNTFNIEVNSGIVTNFEMLIEIEDEIGVKLQEDFIANIDELVVGKKISEIGRIDTIAGASLTTDAFNEALSTLRI